MPEPDMTQACTCGHPEPTNPVGHSVTCAVWGNLVPISTEAWTFAVEVWPLARVLATVRCGSQDWTWEEEWADLDARHAETGYLDQLEQQIRANGITMPVLIGTDGRLWDGHHRLRIAVRLGIGYVPVEVPAGVSQPCKEAPPVPAGLREHVAEAIGLHRNGPASDGRGWYRNDTDRAECHALADAVIAVADQEHTALKRAHVALAEQAGKDQAALARVARLADEHPVHIDTALVLATLDQPQEQP